MKIDRGWLFIAVVLPVSWIVQYVLFTGMLPAKFLVLYMFIPAIAAFIFFLFGKNPVKSQVLLFTRKTALWPWVFALLYPLVWIGVLAAIAVALGIGKFDALFTLNIFTASFMSLLASMIFFMLFSVFGEEYGWRGFMLPALAEKHGKVWATVITGIVWGLWHIPSYFIVYSKAGIGDPYLLTAMGVLTVAVGAFPYSYIFFQNGNILPSVLMHAVYDIAASHVIFGTPEIKGLAPAVPGIVTIYWPYAMGMLIVSGAVMAWVFSMSLAKMKDVAP